MLPRISANALAHVRLARIANGVRVTAEFSESGLRVLAPKATLCGDLLLLSARRSIGVGNSSFTAIAAATATSDVAEVRVQGDAGEQAVQWEWSSNGE